MQIALVLYPKFTVLDIIGPFQALVDVPGHEVVFVGAEAGPVIDHTGRCPLVAAPPRSPKFRRLRSSWCRAATPKTSLVPWPAGFAACIQP